MGCPRRDFLRLSLVCAAATATGCAGLAGLDKPPPDEEVKFLMRQLRHILVGQTAQPDGTRLKAVMDKARAVALAEGGMLGIGAIGFEE